MDRMGDGKVKGDAKEPWMELWCGDLVTLVCALIDRLYNWRSSDRNTRTKPHN